MAQSVVSTTLELLVDGVARGVLFSLLGLGITLVFGLGGILNLAIGVFAVIAVLATVVVLGIVSNIIVALAVSILIVVALGLAVDRSVLSLVYRADPNERELLGIFVTLGLSIFIDGFLYMRFPSGYHVPWTPSTVLTAGLAIRSSSIAIIGVGAIVFAAVYVFLDRTYLGSATRTVMQDETGAKLCGIDPRTIRTLVFVVSVLIAAIAGLLYSLNFAVRVSSQFDLGIYAVLVSIVGGVTNVTGTVAAGLFLGILFTFANAWIGSFVANIVVFLVTVGVLLTKSEALA